MKRFNRSLTVAALSAVPFLAAAQSAPQSCSLTAVAGRAGNAPELPAAALRFTPDPYQPATVLSDGTLVFLWRNIVLRLDSPLVNEWVAGQPIPSPFTTPAPTITALLAEPSGNLLALDGQNLRRLHPDGTSETLAGTGKAGFSGDGGPASQAALNSPAALAYALDGSLLIGDTGNYRIRRIDANGNIQTIAGLGGGDPTIGNDGPATRARIGAPASIAAGPDGSIYFIEGSPSPYSSSPAVLRVITPDGDIHILGGNAPKPNGEGDNVPIADAALTAPVKLAFNPSGQLFVGDQKGVRYLDAGNVLHTVFTSSAVEQFSMRGDGSFFLTVSNATLLVAPDGSQSVVMANDRTAAPSGAPATSVPISVGAITVGPDGHLFVVDTNGPALYRLRDDGTLEKAPQLPKFGYNIPGRMAFDSQGRLVYSGSGAIYRVELDNSITTLASGGDNTTFYSQGRFAIGPDDSVYVGEIRKGAVIRITPDGQASVFWQPAQPSLSQNASLLMNDDGSLLLADGSRVISLLPPADSQTVLPLSQNHGFLDLFQDNGLYLLSTADLWLDAVNGDLDRISLGLTPPPGGAAVGPVMVPDGTGNLYLIESGNTRVLMLRGYASCPVTATPEIDPVYYTDFRSVVTPGMPVTVTGFNLGPLQAVTTQPDGNGMLPTSAGNVQVTVNGIAAPILSAQNRSLTFQIPYGFDIAALNRAASSNGSNTIFTVNYNGATASGGRTMVATSPQPLGAVQGSVNYYVAMVNSVIRNADGSLVGPGNPIPLGALFSVYFYGVGELNPPRATGEVPGIPLRQAVASVSGMLGGTYLEIRWAGEVPGQPGLYQVNFVLPNAYVAPFLSLLVGSTGVNMTIN